MPDRPTYRLLLPLLLALAACSGEISDDRIEPGDPNWTGRGPLAPGATPPAPGQTFAPGQMPSSATAGNLPAARLRRLTLSQYQNSVRDLLGVTADTSSLSTISPLNGLRAIGASSVALPQVDIETFDSLAEKMSAQVFADATARLKLTGCDAGQATCAMSFLASFGRRVFRRPLDPDELTRYGALLQNATEQTGDPWLGLRVTSSALFQSPAFLYRAELGAPDPNDPKRRSLPAYELASRLSFFLWNTTPDLVLLDAAESGALTRPDGLTAQVERLLASTRAKDSADELLSDYLQLDALDSLVKLPETYPQSTATLPAAMKQETLLTLRTLLFDRGADFRTAFTSDKTFANAELAKLYGVKPPTGSDFAEVTLPAGGPRAGLLTQASFLAIHAHPSRSSPTLRGKFIRENLLCQAIPPPPNNVDTSLPANTRDAMTARQRLTRHREDPSCSSCHTLMDPLGLALENFDGIGAYRQTENNLQIDTSGELDGQTFADARSLASVIAQDPNTAACFVRTLLRYGRGTLENDSETGLIEHLSGAFAAADHRVKDLMRTIASDPSFRQVGALE